MTHGFDMNQVGIGAFLEAVGKEMQRSVPTAVGEIRFGYVSVDVASWEMADGKQTVTFQLSSAVNVGSVAVPLRDGKQITLASVLIRGLKIKCDLLPQFECGEVRVFKIDDTADAPTIVAT